MERQPGFEPTPKYVPPREGAFENIPPHPEIEMITKAEPAAILYKGEIFRGGSHLFAMIKLKAKFKDFDDFQNITDGFITTFGRFVDRKEAEELAEKAEQINDDSIGYNGDRDQLDSLDLIH